MMLADFKNVFGVVVEGLITYIIYIYYNNIIESRDRKKERKVKNEFGRWAGQRG